MAGAGFEPTPPSLQETAFPASSGVPAGVRGARPPGLTADAAAELQTIIDMTAANYPRGQFRAGVAAELQTIIDAWPRLSAEVRAELLTIATASQKTPVGR